MTDPAQPATASDPAEAAKAELQRVMAQRFERMVKATSLRRRLFRICPDCGAGMHPWNASLVYRDAEDKTVLRCIECGLQADPAGGPHKE